VLRVDRVQSIDRQRHRDAVRRRVPQPDRELPPAQRLDVRRPAVRSLARHTVHEHRDFRRSVDRARGERQHQRHCRDRHERLHRNLQSTSICETRYCPFKFVAG
jgi:hypothetical protein